MSSHQVILRGTLAITAILMAAACADTRGASAVGPTGLGAANGSSTLTPGDPAPVFLELQLASALPFGAVSDVNGAAASSSATPLYVKRGICNTAAPLSDSCKLMAPDGHQIMWGEWSAIEGRAQAKCSHTGTHFVVHIKNAIPGGVYTLWLNGALGNDDGSENAVQVSAAGEGQLSVIDPVPCVATGSLLILAYHADGQTHGAAPGAPNTWVGQLFTALP